MVLVGHPAKPDLLFISILLQPSVLHPGPPLAVLVFRWLLHTLRGCPSPLGIFKRCPLPCLTCGGAIHSCEELVQSGCALVSTIC